ncbi:26S proteasome non-ATPase regulatory subunit 2-like protein [Apostichopus japonicus]|uniref:26S proteasome non-ATPase regulatory subunit 2-like protein n=1 Tax=Stichopus japonicus TaxID=307972 RepID=A0A2G8LQ59_STIJA|nr:26S proteasome non-ATPase regulatory subunit 2-like protein [Apostichopus japonicus]
MGEEIGSEMSLRSFGHLLRYGEPVIRRSVPLALGLLSVSNPKLQILDTLSKFSHDTDSEVAHNAIFALGIVGAGTGRRGNGRGMERGGNEGIVGAGKITLCGKIHRKERDQQRKACSMLRQLAQYHAKDPANLFMVRLAQGLTHLGKGTLTLCPYHSDRQLLSQVSLAGLLATTVACLDVKTTILGRSHYLMYSLVTAMRPRMLVTFDEELRPLPVQVRVGQSVDVVGQAGKPKTITGFQTHTTPVLLAYGERAELATEEYLPLTPIVEGFVILRKNPDFEQDA